MRVLGYICVMMERGKAKRLTLGCSSRRIHALNDCHWEAVMADIRPSISIQYIEQATVLTLSDRQILEEKNIRTLQQSVVSVVDECEGIHLVLDFCNVEFLSSAVLGLLIRVSKRVHECDGKIRLCNINPKIYEVFRITQLTKVFDIQKDIEDALASFN